MKEEPLFYTGIHPHSYNTGEAGEIIGVVMLTPEVPGSVAFQPRPCFKIRYANGIIDYSPIDQPGAYKLTTKPEPETKEN